MRLLSKMLAFGLVLSLGLAESATTTKSSSDIIRTNTNNIKVVEINKSADDVIRSSSNIIAVDKDVNDVKRSSDNIIAVDKNTNDVIRLGASGIGIEPIPHNELESARKATKSSSINMNSNLSKAHKSTLNKSDSFVSPVREPIVKFSGTRLDCEEGFVDDCSGDGDCCAESWIGDGFGDCADQAYGCDLTCYDNDGGDCDGGGDDGAADGGTTGGGSESCADCELDYTNYGSECCDTAWDEFGINCADLEANYSWDCSGCACPGDIPCEDQGLITCEYGAIAGGDCAEDESGCLEDGACPDGTLADCSGDGDCCAESWIGDGFADCEDQAYGCDLTCYDNDGGDCATEGRAASDGFKSIAQSLKSGRVVSMSLDKKEAIALKDGVITNSGQAVRMGEVIFANESRELTANVEFSVLEGVNGGFTNVWTTDPSLGEFTVYGFDATDLIVATVQFCDGGACSDAIGNTDSPVFAGSEDQWCGEGAGCENAMGDVNNDGTVNVLDIVNIVNHILGAAELVDCDAEAADYNADGTVNVLDIVNIVNMILGGKSADATSATLTKTASVLSISADGYIGGVQMTLSHGADFAIDITDNALVADYKTDGNQTILVVVAPEGEDLFTYSGDFEIVDMIVANSHSEVSVGQPTVFALGSAYPNPFNPTTSLSLSLPESGYVSVKVYNMMGQEIATLADGLMDASAYTLTWDASDASSGMYFVRAEYAGNIATQKLMLLK
jgi:hypothetical protein